jgi:periplasmic protein TonB
MAFESLGSTASFPNSGRAPAPERLSQSGQMIGWGIYGSLVVIGFLFGIVTGYERPKTITVAKVAKEKEKDTSKSDNPKNETPKTTPKPTQESTTSTPPTQPITTPTPVETPAPAPMPTTTPTVDPKPPMPEITMPPKTDPKPSTPATTTTPKVDTVPKKEELQAVSFKADVLPILRKHCLNCHGLALKGKPKGDVDLTTIAKMKNSPGKMVVPGKPEQSEIYTSITSGDMPKDNPPPSEKELLVLKNWILTGAKERRSIRSRNRVRKNRV